MAVAAAGLLLVMLGMIAVFFGVTVSLVYNLVAGLVVGALARLVLPGEEKIGLLGTALVGMAGSAGGHLVGSALHAGQWVQLAIGVAIAAGLLTVLGFRASHR